MLASSTAHIILYTGMQVTARDDSGQVCSHATRQLPSGMLAADGPPTTLSSTGVDRLGFVQANLTRDATYFVNGSPVGARDMCVVRLLAHAHTYAEACTSMCLHRREQASRRLIVPGYIHAIQVLHCPKPTALSASRRCCA